MRITVFGLGYVGAVTAACLAERGHQVTGFDSNPAKSDRVRRGGSPVVEPELDALIAANVRARRLTVAPDARYAVLHSDMSLICIGADAAADGLPDIAPLKKLVADIGRTIAEKGEFHSVVVRTTVPPSTTRQTLLPALESTAGALGANFGLAHHPEFMREGSAIADFRAASRTVIGEFDAPTADRLAALYADAPAVLWRTTPELSEMMKYADNAWHALKVAFANEIGSICNSADIDGQALMDLVCADTRLNMSRAYLRPGFAFGGACLPKDIRTLSRLGGGGLPLLSSIDASNEAHLARCIKWLQQGGHRRIGVLGLAYKAGIGDLRASPFVRIVRQLAAEGREVRVFDPDISVARRTSSHRGYTDDALDGIDALLTDDDDALAAWADAFAVCSPAPAYRVILDKARPDQAILDFARLVPAPAGGGIYRSFM